MSVKAYGAHAADQRLEPMEIMRRAPGPHDAQIDIFYCGICHSGLHRRALNLPDTSPHHREGSA